MQTRFYASAAASTTLTGSITRPLDAAGESESEGDASTEPEPIVDKSASPDGPAPTDGAQG